MLSSVLNSEKAIAMNIAIMRAFTAVKKALLAEQFVHTRLEAIQQTLGLHDTQLDELYAAVDKLLHEKSRQADWNDRERIGFKP